MSDLKVVLHAIAAENKKQYLMLSAILNELAALRETVRDLDPTFSDVLEARQKEAADSTRKFVRLQVELLDKTILKIETGSY